MKDTVGRRSRVVFVRDDHHGAVTGCQGAQQLEHIIATAFGHLDKAETKAFELANLEVLINTVLYNPGAALALMDAQHPHGAKVFFGRWFAALDKEHGLPRVHDKTLSIVALSALLEHRVSGIILVSPRMPASDML